MDVPQEAKKRRSFRAGKGRRRQHPGVQIRPPRDRQPTYVIRYRDPETGKTIDERVTGIWAKNKDTVTEYAKEKSQQLQERKRQILGGATPHRAAMMEVADALEVYFRGHDVNPQALKIYRAAADELIAWCERVGINTVRQLGKEALREFRDQLRSAPKRVPVQGGKRGEWTDSKEPRSIASTNNALPLRAALLELAIGDGVHERVAAGTAALASSHNPSPSRSLGRLLKMTHRTRVARPIVRGLSF